MGEGQFSTSGRKLSQSLCSTAYGLSVMFFFAHHMTREPRVTQTTLRTALTCWCIDPDHGMTPPQHAWLTIRLAARTPLTPEERARLRAPLLAWCRRCGGERLAAMVERQYAEDEALVPQEVHT